MKVRLEFKLEDFWVGAFWKKTTYVENQMYTHKRLDIWVCIVPCFPLHITLKRPGMWGL